MNKILHMNSLFTKIILAVLSFAIILCIFVPYTQIDGIDQVHDVDLVNKKLALNIGAGENSVNIISEFATQPYQVFEDEDRSVVIEDTSALPVAPEGTTYQFVTYAYGYDANDSGSGLGFIETGCYQLVLKRGIEGNQYSKLSIDKVNKVITIDVPATQENGEKTFDLSRAIDIKKAWLSYPQRISGSLAEADRNEHELTNLKVKAGDAPKQYYVGLSLKSESDPFTQDDTAAGIYYPLEMYTLTIFRDASKNRLPQVGEIGRGFLSRNSESLVKSDLFMFAFMIAAAISTLFSFIISNKIRIIEFIIAEILGIACIVMPILDWVFYFSKNSGFHFEPGMFIIMGLGVLIVLFAVFDFIRCRSEYKEEQIRIYGEDAFKKKKD